MKTIEFGDMVWGSCQYDMAAQMYRYLLCLEDEVGRDAVLKVFNQSLGVSLSAENVYDKLVKEMMDTWKDDQDMFDNVRVAVQEHSEKTISNCFTICRDMAWDLWSAAPGIAGLVFPNLDLTKIPRTLDDKTFGPLGNLIAQAENDPTGFCCWLLKTFDYAEESDFMDFDT